MVAFCFRRAFNGWFPGAPAPAPGSHPFPITFVTARDIEPEQMPASVKGGIAASAIAAGGAVAVGLYLAAAEQRRRKKIRTGQILLRYALVGWSRSLSSDPSSLSCLCLCVCVSVCLRAFYYGLSVSLYLSTYLSACLCLSLCVCMCM